MFCPTPVNGVILSERAMHFGARAKDPYLHLQANLSRKPLYVGYLSGHGF